MPWVPEQKEEFEKDLKELHNLGLIDQKEYKKRIKAVGGGLAAKIDNNKNVMK